MKPLIWVNEGKGYHHAHERGQTSEVANAVCDVLICEFPHARDTTITLSLPKMRAKRATALAERLYREALTELRGGSK